MKIKSLEKNSKMELGKNMLENENHKKKTRNLSTHSFNENDIDINFNQKFDKSTSQIALYKNKYITSLNEPKSKTININDEKKSNDKNSDDDYLKVPEITNLSQKEKACLILAYSKCLRLTERLIFSVSSPKLKEAISKNQILEANKIYLNEKLEELEKKIEMCNNKLSNKFNASKTAEITLNFITLNIETDFKLNFLENIEDEADKQYCFNYIKLLYLVLGENYYTIQENDLVSNLYSKIEEKNFVNIKDYLFHLYIQNNDGNKSLDNIDRINELIKITPDIFSFKVTTKFDKFILYCSVLLNEIIKYDNQRLDTMKLIKDCKNFIEIINMKLNSYQRRAQSN